MKKIFNLFILVMSIILFNNKVFAYEEYAVGDKVTYNDEEYYVIENSDSSANYVTLLKDKPLTIEELYKYGRDENGNLFINEYSPDLFDLEKLVYEYSDGSGGIAYYSNENCGYQYIQHPSFSYSYHFREYISSGCINDYDKSDIKKVLENWSQSFDVDLVDVNGYKVRLITTEELVNDLSCENQSSISRFDFKKTNDTPEWVYDISSPYWTLSNSFNDSAEIPVVSYHRDIYLDEVQSKNSVRPVINLYKCALNNNSSECSSCNEYVNVTKSVTRYNNYKAGDEIDYNGKKYTVINTSNENEKYLSLLDSQFENLNISSTYYTSETCQDKDNTTGCTNNYDQSNIKQIVNEWESKTFDNDDLVSVDGYKSRLLTVDELVDNLGYIYDSSTPGQSYTTTDFTPSFITNCMIDESRFWLMSGSEDNEISTYSIGVSGSVSDRFVYASSKIRPVINLRKSVIGTNLYYKIGNEIKYKGEKYHVIEDSDSSKEYVTLLKCDVLNNKTIIDKCELDGGCYEEEYQAEECVDGDDDIANSSNNNSKLANDNQQVTVENTLKTVSNLVLIISLILIISGIGILGYNYIKSKRKNS